MSFRANFLSRVKSRTARNAPTPRRRPDRDRGHAPRKLKTEPLERRQLLAATLAASADQFVDSIGINARLNLEYTQNYNNYAYVREALLESGIRHLRNASPDSTANAEVRQTYISRLNELADQGIKTLLTINARDSNGVLTNSKIDEALAAIGELNPDVAAGIVGVNEYDLNKPSIDFRTAEQAYIEYHTALAQKVRGHSDPTISELPIIAGPYSKPFGLAFLDDAPGSDALKDLVDVANIHAYTDQRPELNPKLRDQREVLTWVFDASAYDAADLTDNPLTLRVSTSIDDIPGASTERNEAYRKGNNSLYARVNYGEWLFVGGLAEQNGGFYEITTPLQRIPRSGGGFDYFGADLNPGENVIQLALGKDGLRIDDIRFDNLYQINPGGGAKVEAQTLVGNGLSSDLWEIGGGGADPLYAFVPNDYGFRDNTDAGVYGLTADVYGADKPLIMTEAGYEHYVTAGNLNDIDGNESVSYEAAGKYWPRYLATNFQSGVERTYIYDFWQQFDRFNTLGGPNELLQSSFGLIGIQELADANGVKPYNGDGSQYQGPGVKRPAYYSVANLISILGEATLNDGEFVSPDFTPGQLDFQLEGQTEGVQTILLQKSDGRFYLGIWNDAPVWDYIDNVDRPATSTPVTLRFNQPVGMISQYAGLDQVGGDMPDTHFVRPGYGPNGTDVNPSITVDVTKGMTLLEIDPPRELYDSRQSRWTDLSNAWTDDAGRLATTAAASASTVFAALDLDGTRDRNTGISGSFSFDAASGLSTGTGSDAQFNEQSLQVVFDYEDANNYQSIVFRGRDDKIRFLKRSGGVNNVRAEVDFDFEAEQSYDFDIDLEKLYYDNITTVTVKIGGIAAELDYFNDINLSDGAVAVAALRADGGFESLQVTNRAVEDDPIVLFSSEFAAASQDVEIVSGQWETEASQLRLTDPVMGGASTALLPLPAPLAANYDFRTNLTIPSDGVYRNATILFDYKDSANYKAVFFNADGNQVAIESVENGIKVGNKVVGQAIDTDVQHSVELEIRRDPDSTWNHVRVKLNGNYVNDQWFQGDALGGTLGLRTYQSKLDVDDLQVVNQYKTAGQDVPDGGSVSDVIFNQTFGDATDTVSTFYGDWTVTDDGRLLIDRFNNPVPTSVQQIGGTTIYNNPIALFETNQPIADEFDVYMDVWLTRPTGDDIDSNAFLIFDYVDYNNYKFAYLQIEHAGGNSRVLWFNRVNGVNQYLSQEAYDFQLDQKYYVTLRARGEGSGTRMSMNIYGTALQGAWYPDSSLSDGKVGVGVWNSNTYFDNVRIRNNDTNRFVYRNRFETSHETLDVLSGDWQESDGVITGLASGNNLRATTLLQTGGDVDQGVTLEGTFQWPDTSAASYNLSFVYDYIDAGSYKAVVFNGDDNTVEFLERVSAATTAQRIFGGVTLDPGVSYDFEIVVRPLGEGFEARLVIDGVYVGQKEYLEPLNGGRIGIELTDSEANIRDLHIQSIV